MKLEKIQYRVTRWPAVDVGATGAEQNKVSFSPTTPSFDVRVHPVVFMFQLRKQNPYVLQLN